MDKNTHNNLLDLINVAIVEQEMVYDNNGNPIDYRYLHVNQAFCDLVGKSKEEIIGNLSKDVLREVKTGLIKQFSNILNTGEQKSFTNFTSDTQQCHHIDLIPTSKTTFISCIVDVTQYMDTLSPERQISVMSNLVQNDLIAYFEFDLQMKQFDYSPILGDILGKDILTFDDYYSVFFDHIHPKDQKKYTDQKTQLFDGTIDQLVIQVRFKHLRTMNYKWISIVVFVDEREQGVPVKLRGIVKDIDYEHRLELEQLEMQQLFQETRKIANISTFNFDLSTNQFRASDELDEFIGVKNIRELNQIRDLVHPDDIETYDFSTREIVNHPEGMVTSYRIILEGTTRYIQSSIFPDVEDDGTIRTIYGILKDTTEQEQSKQEIEYYANHDVLTGLYNRLNFERYSKVLQQEENLVLMICDVDGLKLINDAFGHIEGDTLLNHLADILRDVAGEENVYRIGGDEFVLTLHQLSDSDIVNYERDIKRRVHAFRIYGVGFDVSIGYSRKIDDQTLEEVFRKAENIMYRRKLTERKSRKSTALSTIMQTMHERTEETEEHCTRVSDLAVELLRASGKNREHELEEIRLVANFHDIGKISISDHILMKPGKLTDAEFEAIQYHSESGYKIISNIIDNEDIAMAVLYHHERYNGTGYPHQLTGENIPLYARIISICDAYDAMTSNRVYSKALTKKQAIREINNNAGSQFDPGLVEKFNQIIKKW